MSDLFQKIQLVRQMGHERAHRGDSFYYHDVASLTGSGSQNYLIITPNSVLRCHFGLEVDYNNGAATTEIYEGSDRTGAGAVTTFNRNRNSSRTPTVIIHKGYTGGTTDGTRIFWKRIGSGKTTGGETGTAEERILKANTQYTLRLTDASSSTNNFSLVLRWYEAAI